MPYILNKTNGTIVATVQDASLDLTTDLIFVGRNYAGYGEWQNENFLKLLENFSNPTPPIKSIEGQIWYNSSSKQLSVYTGVNWSGIANLDISSLNPTISKTPSTGNLWYNSIEQQLHVYNGSDYKLIGPPSGAGTLGQWAGSFEIGIDDTRRFNIKAIIGQEDEVIAVASANTFQVKEGNTDSYPITPGTELKKGINLIGADNITGVSATSSSTGSLFWGTAAHALRADSAASSTGLTVQELNDSNVIHFPYFGDTAGAVYRDNGLQYRPSTNTLIADVFQGVATSARYADLAERYEADAIYDFGTVVVLGGSAEITVTSKRANTAVAGIISKDPGFKMNADAGSDLTHPYVALTGRVPCKVSGPVKKGELLVTSKRDGYAEAWRTGDSPHSVIGRALEDFEGSFGVIEVKV